MRHVLFKYLDLTTEHSPPLSSHPRQMLALLMGAQLLVACSLAPPPGRSITISLPQSSGTATVARTQGSHLRDGGPSETSYASFNCYAINVTAADISTMPNVACAGTPLGIIAGFVPSSAGSITISVPDGAARTFQLIGLGSNVACPNLNNILNLLSTNSPNLKQATQGLGQPYVLGSATTDISADTAITIDAGFDAATSQVLFRNCVGPGESQGYPPSAAIGVADDRQGPYDGSNASYAFLFARSPSTNLNGSELNVSATPGTPLSGNPAQPLIQASTQGSQSTYQGEGVAEVTAMPGYRSVVQLRWDASNWNLTTYPYAAIQLQIAGGVSAGDATDSACQPFINRGTAQVAAAAWDPVRGQWIPLAQGTEGFGAEGSQVYWFGTSNDYGIVPASELLMTSSVDGHPYLVVNVESNFVAGDGCSSAVYVAGAQVNLFANIQANNAVNSLISVQPIGAVMPGGCDEGGCAYDTVSGESLGLLVYGGIPPYKFQMTGGEGGAFDPVTGHLIAGPTGDTETIAVTDSSGVNAPAVIAFDVVDPTQTNSILLKGMTVNGSTSAWSPVQMAAGDCISLELGAAGFGYRPLALTTAESVYVNYPKGPADITTAPFSSSTAAEATCAQGSNVATIGPSSSSWVSFEVTGATPPGLATVINVGPTSNGPWTTIPIKVASGAVHSTGISASSPRQINTGACTPLWLTLQDTWGNDVAEGTAQESLTNLYLSPGGSFFAGATCQSSQILPSVTLPELVAGAPIGAWFRSTLAGSTNGSSQEITGTGISGPFNSYTVEVYPPTEATQLILQGPSLDASMAGQCVPFSVTPVDSAGNYTSPAVYVPSGTYVDFSFTGAAGTVFSNAACTAPLSQLVLNPTGPTNFSVLIPAAATWSLEAFEPYEASCANTLCLGMSNVLGF